MLLSSSHLLAQDLALALPAGEILQPVSGCSLGSNENVSIRIFNFGTALPAGSLFTVSYTINSGAPVSELVQLTSPLLSHSSFNYTFTLQTNLSAPGNYIFDASVSLAGDINPTNNAFTGYLITNSAATVGGSVSADQTICGTTNSGSLTLSGHTGDILRWETSQDAGLTWRYVSQTTAQQNFLNLGTTTQYRAVVSNGGCGEAASSDATVTITCALPLTWTSFTANRAGNNVELNWRTADEVNTSHFVIERAEGDNLFHDIGTVHAQYRYIDLNAPTVALQYRIRQVDLDNRYSYSPVRRISGINGPPSLRLRSNPLNNGVLSIDVKEYPVGNAVITICDMNGKKIRSATTWLHGSNQVIDIPMHGVSAGIYFLSLRSGKLFENKKFMVSQ
jgi:hypothetical protein